MALPTGTIIPFAGPTPPTGFLLCNGQEVGRVEFEALFLVIGEAYGQGDDALTFNLPDLRGRTVVGVGVHGDVSALGANEGAVEGNRRTRHSHSGATLPAHGHAFTGDAIPVHNHGFTGAGIPAHKHGFTGGALPAHSHDLTGATLPAHTHTFDGALLPDHVHHFDQFQVQGHAHGGVAKLAPDSTPGSVQLATGQDGPTIMADNTNTGLGATMVPETEGVVGLPKAIGGSTGGIASGGGAIGGTVGALVPGATVSGTVEDPSTSPAVAGTVQNSTSTALTGGTVGAASPPGAGIAVGPQANVSTDTAAYIALNYLIKT